MQKAANLALKHAGGIIKPLGGPDVRKNRCECHASPAKTTAINILYVSLSQSRKWQHFRSQPHISKLANKL
jgi:hypothetical protein